MKRFHTLSWQVPAPPVGQGVGIVFSPVQRVKLKSLIIPLTTSVVVASRAVFVTLKDPTGLTVFETGNAAGQAASLSQDYVLSSTFSTTTALQGPVNAAIGLGFPDIWLPPAWSITIGAKLIDVGDQFGAVDYVADFAEDVWDQEEDQLLLAQFLASLT